MRWRIVAKVRKRPAEGAPYQKGFFVQAPEGAKCNELMDLWFEQFSDEWELFSFRSMEHDPTNG